MPKRYRREGSGGKFLFLLLCLAGLGVGVWLFGKRRRGAEQSRRAQNGS